MSKERTLLKEEEEEEKEKEMKGKHNGAKKKEEQEGEEGKVANKKVLLQQLQGSTAENSSSPSIAAEVNKKIMNDLPRNKTQMIRICGEGKWARNVTG